MSNNKKISELAPLSDISGDEKVVVAVGGENFNVDLSSLKNYVAQGKDNTSSPIIIPYTLESQSDEAKELFAAIATQSTRPVFIEVAAQPTQYIPCVVRVADGYVRLYGSTVLGASNNQVATTQLRYMQIADDGTVKVEYGAWYLLSEKSVIDELSTTDKVRPLSANMGRRLNEDIQQLKDQVPKITITRL